MYYQSPVRERARSLFAAILVLACGTGAYAQDVYNSATRQLTIPSIVIGNALYTDMVVTVGTIDILPSGTYPYNNGDFFEPDTQQLTVAQVTVGSTTYYNPVVTVTNLVSIGGVAGADTYDGSTAFIPAAQLLGGSIYTNVQITLAHVDSVANGMPLVSQNEYDPATGKLTVPVAVYAGKIYTNAIVTVGQVKSVGGSQLTDSVLQSFAGGTDGAVPYSNLVQGSDGNFYGVTNLGGTANSGTVFKMFPSGAESVLYTFTGGADGAYPYAALVQGPNGSFYGTTTSGGAFGQGVVFSINPTTGVQAVLHSFSGNGGVTGSTDGAIPNGLILGSDGNFYGTTSAGGAVNNGTIFMITPGGTETTLYAFGGGSDGAYPYGALLQATDGNFYGTTYLGGAYSSGAVFKYTAAHSESVLYSFSGAGGALGSNDGALPQSNLIQATDGNFYGTTFIGGTYGVGTVFKLTPTGTESVLYSFSGAGGVPGSADGAYLYAGVIQATDGNFYGATNNGGAYNEGTVFKLTPAGAETVIYSFNGAGALTRSNDGAYPNGVIQGADGSFYGTAFSGGDAGNGVVFKLAGPVP